MSRREHHGTIFVEDSEVLSIEAYAGEQFVVRLAAPRTARAAMAGSFVHVTCDPLLPMRRPLSIMRVDREAGWIDLLFKIVGPGLKLLSQRRPGQRVSLLGPIGRGFVADPQRPRCLLIGGGVGIPPMVFLADTLRADSRSAWQPLVLMGSEIPFPFAARPSTILVPGVGDSVIACMPLLDQWGVPSRLASLAGFPGCYEGYVTALAELWLADLAPGTLAEVQLFACGPTPMLAAAADIARRYRVPCQVSLEEFMACAVGGCAGCAVRVITPDGPAMKRVCVDGPVFPAEMVFPADAA